MSRLPIRASVSHAALRVFVAAFALGLATFGAPGTRVSRSPDPTAGAASAVLAAGFGQLPLTFVTNAGQADPWAGYYVHGDATSVLFGPNGLSFRLSRPPTRDSDACPDRRGRALCLADWRLGPPPDPLAPLAIGRRAGDVDRGTVDAVGLSFVGGRAGARPEAEALAPTVFSYFSGRREDWHTGLSSYGRLVYRDVWPGIDVVFEGTVQRVKHTFVVRPGADPAAIRLAWRGATGLQVDDGGALVVDTPGGRLVDEAPVAFQVIEGRRVEVAAAYALDGGKDDDAGATGVGAKHSQDGGPSIAAKFRANASPLRRGGVLDVDGGIAGHDVDAVAQSRSYGFTLGAYDPTRTLHLDPAIVVWAGFFGAEGFDRGLGIALGPEGHVFVAGESGSAAYIARLTPDGRTLERVGLIDGDGKDAAFDIDVDARGAAYVTGPTSSLEDSFPLANGPDLTFNGGFIDGYVAKVSPDGEDLEYSGYIGGSGTDFGEGIAVDDAGFAYLSGLAESTEATFPVTVGPDLTHNGEWDAYVLKLKPEPTASRVRDNYAWAGFVGGAGHDVLVNGDFLSAGHIGIDGAGNAYMSGQTTSTEATFPDGDGFGSLPGPDKTFNGGEWDAYVIKVRADGTGLAYAGYIGGAGYDEGKGMAVDADGAAYITGATTSDEGSFPVAAGPDLTHNGLHDAFIAKIRPDGSGLAFCGYVGGIDDDQGQAVKLGPDGALYVAGRTESAEGPVAFPSVVGPDTTHNGPIDEQGEDDGADAFVGRLAAPQASSGRPFDLVDPLRNWDFLGFIGGDEGDGAYWIDVDRAGNAYVVGDTTSGGDTFPDGDGFGPVAGWRHTNAGAGDAFVARIDWTAPPAPKPRIYLPFAGQSALPDDVPSTIPAITSTHTPGPRPSATRAPTDLPTPIRAPTKAITPPAGEEVVFFDDFSDPASGWIESTDPADSYRYIDGEFEMATDAIERFVHQEVPGVRRGDGAVEVTMHLTDDSDAFYGLMFGPLQGPFLLLVETNGTYRLVQAFGTGVRSLVGPAISPHIAHGTQPNRLRIERTGGRIVLLANGEVLAVVDDPALAERGPIRPLLGTNADAPATLRIDDFLVTRWAAGRPTPTDVPTPTPAPSSTPVPGGTVLFSDDFSDPSSGWAVSDTADDRMRYIDGEYEITLHAIEIFAAGAAPRVQCANCTVEADARFLSSVLGIAGLVVGENGQAAIVLFEVLSDGRYAVERYDGTNWQTLAPVTRSSAIKSGAGEKNRLKAVRHDGRLTLFANDVELTTVDAPGLTRAGVGGVMAISGSQPELVARFDDFIMRAGGAVVRSGVEGAP